MAGCGALPIDMLRAVLACGPPLRLAVLFGSAVKDRLRPDSDLDIAILWEDPVPLADELDLQTRLAEAAGRWVDLLSLERASTLLRWEVARGQVLLARPTTEWPRFVASAACEYLDAAPALHAAARRFARHLARGRQ